MDLTLRVKMFEVRREDIDLRQNEFGEKIIAKFQNIEVKTLQ